MPVQFVYDTKCPVEELDSNTCSEIHFLHGKEGANCLSLWHKLVFTLWQKGNRADGGTMSVELAGLWSAFLWTLLESWWQEPFLSRANSRADGPQGRAGDGLGDGSSQRREEKKSQRTTRTVSRETRGPEGASPGRSRRKRVIESVKEGLVALFMDHANRLQELKRWGNGEKQERALT